MNHPNLLLVFPIRSWSDLTVRRVEGSLRRWTFIALVGVTLVALWSISLEMFATTTVFGGIAMLIALIVAREDRVKLWSATLQIGIGYAIAIAVVFVPYLLPALQTAPHAVMRDNERSSDPLQLLYPNTPYVLGGAWLEEMGTRYKGHVYVGFGIIAVMIGFAITEWRRRWTRPLLAFIGDLHPLRARTLAVGRRPRHDPLTHRVPAAAPAAAAVDPLSPHRVRLPGGCRARRDAARAARGRATWTGRSSWRSAALSLWNPCR